MAECFEVSAAMSIACKYIKICIENKKNKKNKNILIYVPQPLEARGGNAKTGVESVFDPQCQS